MKISREVEGKIEKFLRVIRSMEDFSRVKFIMLYGSAAVGKEAKFSDVDLCLYYLADKPEDMSRFRLKLLSKLPEGFDVHVFQQLPPYVKREVLKGKLVYGDRKFVSEVAYRTIKDYEAFKPRYYDYIYR